MDLLEFLTAIKGYRSFIIFIYSTWHLGLRSDVTSRSILHWLLSHPARSRTTACATGCSPVGLHATSMCVISANGTRLTRAAIASFLAWKNSKAHSCFLHVKRECYDLSLLVSFLPICENIVYMELKRGPYYDFDYRIFLSGFRSRYKWRFVCFLLGTGRCNYQGSICTKDQTGNAR